MDNVLVSLWRQAEGKSLETLAATFREQNATRKDVCAALACLTEAGLLTREGESTEEQPAYSFSGDKVSAVIVSYNGKEWLKECLASLAYQTYSPLEIIVVDNASSDDSIEWLKINFPTITLIVYEKTEPLSRAINRGVSEAQGDYFLVLNQDVWLERDAVAQMVATAAHDPSCAAVAPKIKFWWAPNFLNGIGNRVGAFSWGTDNGIGHLDLGQFDAWRQVPSVCFAATLIPRRAWERVGRIDEEYPLYYEDVDWSYRARLIGLNTRAAPRAIVYHAFGGRVPSGEQVDLTPSKLRNVVYGRLRFALKILGQLQPRFLRNYLLEDWGNFLNYFVHGNIRMVLAYMNGWAQASKTFSALRQEGRLLQKQRVRSDDELFQSNKHMPAPLVWHGLPELTWDLVKHHYLPILSSGVTRNMQELDEIRKKPHLLIVSHDVVAEKMAGQGMRYLEMARALKDSLDVTLAVPSATTMQMESVRLVQYDETRPQSVRILVDNSDVALVSGHMVQKFPFLKSSRSRIVVDLLTPFLLENLHYYVDETIEAQEEFNTQAIDITNQLAQLGDFFLCGSERQRDFWLGVLAANGRINPHTFNHDPMLRRLVGVLGFGIPNHPPTHKRPIFRGTHARFGKDCKIVWWGGGMWDWLDSVTLVRAWKQVVTRHPEARLIFMSGHPNPLVPRHKIAAETLRIAEEIGERDRTIFFPDWLSYADRESALCEADIGAVLHPHHLETRFSVRTRVLDFIWARLPILISSGDTMSDLVREKNLGCVVAPQDPDAVADALSDLLNHPKTTWSDSFEALSESICWSNVVTPLQSYCYEGSYAPDRLVRETVEARTISPEGWRNLFIRADQIRRNEGMRVMLHRVRRYLQWRLAAI